MFYHAPGHQQGYELRRLFEVKVIVSGPTAKRKRYKKHTIIAWNQAEATNLVEARAKKPVAELPTELDWVTWDEPPRIIKNPTDGPTDEIAEPTLGFSPGGPGMMELAIQEASTVH